MLVKQLKSIEMSGELTFLTEIIVKGLLFGPIQRKDDK